MVCRLMFSGQEVEAVSDSGLQSWRSEIIESIQMTLFSPEEVTSEDAHQILSELEYLTIQYGDLSNSSAYIHPDFKPARLNVSHGQEMEILEYLTAYRESQSQSYVESVPEESSIELDNHSEELESSQNDPASQANNSDHLEQIYGVNYAPYTYQDYYYQGAGSPLEGGDDYRKVTLQYEPDRHGFYQFVVEEDIFGEYSATTYVYQITTEGVFEQSYFETANEAKDDYRYHADTMNEYASLILPLDIYPGLTFYSGYRNQTEYEVIKVHDSFDLMGTTYDDVIEVRRNTVDNQSDSPRHLFYAPKVGLIAEAFAIEGTNEYNYIHFLESYTPSANPVPSSSNEEEYPFAVNLDELGSEVSFHRPENQGRPNDITMDLTTNKIGFNTYDNHFSNTNQTSWYAFEIQNIPSEDITVSGFESGFEDNREVTVNTQVIIKKHLGGTDFGWVGRELFLFYNQFGGFSFVTDTDLMNMSVFTEYMTYGN